MTNEPDKEEGSMTIEDTQNKLEEGGGNNHTE